MQPRRTFGRRFFEYFVVAGVIVTLTAVSFVFLSDALAKARDAQRIADMVALRTALELYHSDFQEYPDTMATSDSETWDTFEESLAPYLSALPTDPLEKTGEYHYEYRAMRDEETGRSDYVLSFRLERSEDSPLAGQVNLALAADATDTDMFTLSAP